ncbi:hypothetical protein KTH_15170 [Thermosporothrix hazakensis]|uniref:Uncharacterized protein n=1 Tax=Thermosporothrix sp. COM3 TaxID=2490863 RepID=A0A455SNH9_9CHLR|nr:hypothetical protein KTC_32130 [Thermosporothrix sp. COM3]GCE46648.1 hypothetical protein KTH_15170 [Thermosporothrix hazakensis]
MRYLPFVPTIEHIPDTTEKTERQQDAKEDEVLALLTGSPLLRVSIALATG